MSDFWNERYSEKEYVYGEAPNVFFATQLNTLPQGTIILPCEGEGRNAVYAAAEGWKVNAFDSSEAGKIKAVQLADKRKLVIDYVIDDATAINYPENSVDVVAFIYAHFPVSIRTQIHRKAIQWLKPGGKIIIEAFNPDQLKNNSGGPKELSMLYTEEILKEDFQELQIECLQTLQTILSEGEYHQGVADIIRFVAVKK
ncbi:class I SAM-dependent methyltransferase [Ferruginibacter sp.]|nr:class I SAM-dependent methyltransferase [Ferruginibacter sp.]